MKKIITRAAIAAIAITGVSSPVASAQSSEWAGLSSSLSSTKYINTPADLRQALNTLLDGYHRHYTTRGYNFNASADSLAKQYFNASDVHKEQLRKDLEASGLTVEVFVTLTNQYEDTYRTLLDVTPEPNVGKQWGGYIHADSVLTTATIVRHK
ncbi:hypothetical protein ACOI1A_12765 [Corynebacterium glutamicum]|uniref:hypothetical protein n=1 Tax=Corynebacterium glutamicum TaxID=1718 RepID=UPI003B6378F1